LSAHADAGVQHLDQVLLDQVLDACSALADIREADEAYARGVVLRGVEEVRRLRR